MCALRGAGSGAGLEMGRHTVLLPVLRAAAMAPGSLEERLVSREGDAPRDCPGEAKRAVRGRVRKSRAAAGTRRTSAPAAIPRWCPTLNLGNNGVE